MRVILIILATFISSQVLAATQDCGVVNIDKILAGPRHGAMMKVSNTSCGGGGGWICLDPNAEHMSTKESDKLFSFILSQKRVNQSVQLSVYSDVFSVACNGPYPVVEDVRIP